MMERKPHTSEFGSVDPAPPQLGGQISTYKNDVLNNDIPMFQRMRAVFALRNVRSDEAALALCEGFHCSSALLRHEIAYVLGQMQNNVVLPKLTEVLSDEEEHVMVRHEAAEAMGAIGDRSIINILEKFKNHPQPEIAESCIVALDLLQWVQSAEFEDFSE